MHNLHSPPDVSQRKALQTEAKMHTHRDRVLLGRVTRVRHHRAVVETQVFEQILQVELRNALQDLVSLYNTTMESECSP